MLRVLICTVHLTVCTYHVTYAFQSESTFYSCLNVKELLAWSRCEIWSLSDCNWTRTHNHFVHKRTLDHLAKLAKWLSCVVSNICKVHLTVCSYHVTYSFHSESTFYSCLNVKELLARSRREIWSLSDSNWTRTHNHLVHKPTLDHLAKLARWLSCVVSFYLYGAFDCMFLSCHACVSACIHTFTPASSKEVIEIQATIECGFTLKRVHDMIRIYMQMHRTNKYSQHSFWPFGQFG